MKILEDTTLLYSVNRDYRSLQHRNTIDLVTALLDPEVSHVDVINYMTVTKKSNRHWVVDNYNKAKRERFRELDFNRSSMVEYVAYLVYEVLVCLLSTKIEDIDTLHGIDHLREFVSEESEKYLTYYPT